MVNQFEVESSIAPSPQMQEVSVIIDGVEVDKVTVCKGGTLESEAVKAALKGRVVRDSSFVGGMVVLTTEAA